MNKLILWDFDGVIVPSFQAGLETYKIFHPDYTEEEYRKGYEGNIFKNSEHLNLPQDKFNEEYGSRVERLGIEEQIEMAVKKVTTLHASVIVSSSSNLIIIAYLARHGLKDCFKKLYGNEIHFSKIKKIAMALKDFDSDSENSVFITDTLGDIKEAEAHNMKTIGVTWGFHPRETLEKGKPDVILDDPQKLAETVESLIQ